MFKAIDWLFQLRRQFRPRHPARHRLVKIVFFPLANKSYASMAKMKAVQPEMMAIRERYGDDKMKQQQAMMELYKKEKINPLAGCLPILIQIPVFFALYKVLFVTIEMRHAPFFGWIKDLSAPDPTNLFNLFGLIPFDPTRDPGDRPVPASRRLADHHGHHDVVQMKLNPAPPDPTQKMIFNWMPVIFTFMLAAFPAGLVIYWAWNNTLSVLQQAFIMKQARRQDRAVGQHQGAVRQEVVTARRRRRQNKRRIILRRHGRACPGHLQVARARLIGSPAKRGDDGREDLRRRRAHEVALAELDAALAQDVVGGGGVEIEVRQALPSSRLWPVNSRTLPFGKVILISLPSVPSTSLCLTLLRNSMVLAMRSLSCAIVVSSLANFGSSLPAAGRRALMA